MRGTQIVAMALLCGCATQEKGDRGDEPELSGEAELLLSTTSGEEEAMALNEQSVESYGAPLEIDQPLLFRDCDAPDHFTQLFADYDSNDNQDLEADEEDNIHAHRKGRDRGQQRMAHHRWHFLNWLYDANDDDVLAEDERSVLLDDHTARCESIHAVIMDEYDADGDGLLSEAEQEQAMAAAMDRHEAHHDRMREHHKADRRGHPGHRHERPDVPPPVMEEFDADADGALSLEEAQTARSELRQRIRSGEPPCGLHSD